MQRVTIPDYVRGIVERLEWSGNKAYLVGGCVRDMLLGRYPGDWDVCTGALPEQVMKIFPEALPIGLKHGTVAIIRDKESVEVTTFRSDGCYIGHRRPDNVTFISELNQDLVRRDFTMNAMASDLTGRIFDPAGGRRDLADRVIRCVGDPAERFHEDALRMFRALRFSAQLGFSVHKDTVQGIRDQYGLAVYVSAERIRNELTKTIMSSNPHCVKYIVDSGLLDKYIIRRPREVGVADMQCIKTMPMNGALRWAGVCAVLEAGGVISSAGDFLKSLRLPQKIVRPVSKGVHLAVYEAPVTALEWKRALADGGSEVCLCAAAGICALAGTDYSKAAETLNAVISGGECVSINELAISGLELLELGISGADVGRTLRMLLDYVLINPEHNKRECLLELASKL